MDEVRVIELGVEIYIACVNDVIRMCCVGEIYRGKRESDFVTGSHRF